MLEPPKIKSLLGNSYHMMSEEENIRSNVKHAIEFLMPLCSPLDISDLARRAALVKNACCGRMEIKTFRQKMVFVALQELGPHTLETRTLMIQYLHDNGTT